MIPIFIGARYLRDRCEVPPSRYVFVGCWLFLSFDGWNAQRLQILHERGAGGTPRRAKRDAFVRPSILFAVFLFALAVAKGHSGINLVEVSLKPLFGFFRQASELDAHAYTGIAGANDGAGGEALLIDP